MVALKKVVFMAAIAIIATVLSGCQTYQVKMSYQCITPPVAPNTMCMQWEQIGGVETPSTCFPGRATVTTRNGPKSMAELKIGDEILGLDESTLKEEFTRVRAWLHRDVEASSEMVAMTGFEGTLTASPHHLMGSAAFPVHLMGISWAPSVITVNYNFVSELPGLFVSELPGSKLLTHDHQGMQVISLSPTVGHGLYAPLTATSNFFVGSPELNTSVLASSFAEVRHPERYAYALQRIMDVAEYFDPSIHEVHSSSYLHPVARVLMTMFPGIIERHIKGQETILSGPSKQSVVV